MDISTLLIILGIVLAIFLIGFLVAFFVMKNNREKNALREGVELVPMMIHLPPSTDDIEGNGRDERDITNEAISQAQVMYSIIASSVEKNGKSTRKYISFEITAKDGVIKYFVFVPKEKIEVIKQAVVSAYPTAILEESERINIFIGSEATAGTELELKKEAMYPIATYEETKRDASLAMLNALSSTKNNEGLSVQILCRPAKDDWIKKSIERTKILKHEKVNTKFISDGSWWADAMYALVRPPEDHEKVKTEERKTLSNLEQDEVAAIENKTKYPGFETLIRIVAAAQDKGRAEALVGGLVTAFSQFESVQNNGFKFSFANDSVSLAKKYILRDFPAQKSSNILNSVELASVFHLPQQNVIPTSQVERQLFKQVDGPAKLANEGILLGENEFRGEKKKIYLDDDNRRRHLYMIGQTGSGKSVFLENLAYQDMCAGRGFAFIDPHGDAVEALLQRVPKDRIDDVIYFDPADIEHPVGMNMFEFSNPDQKDFIVQEGINMLQSLFDPQNQGFFGPRGQHMFRNAALLLMSDPNGATFVDIPQCFTDPAFVKSKLKYVTDKAVYDYWTKEFPASQKSSDAGEVVTWFSSKWGPFLSNTMMRNILGQTKSGFNIREIMDNKKIFLVNLSKGRVGDINANLLGMILVMKIQQAAMSRADTPEEQRQDFCLYVDEFQNFATESFESILSEARKYRLNLIVANQFMTQLTEKIREAILGNVGTILSGRLGVTDAELMVKAFSPVFSTEDLMKQPNYSVICKVMMFGMPSSPFTMKFLPPMGEPNVELMKRLKEYSALKYSKSRKEVEKEISERWTVQKEKPAETSPEALQGGETKKEPNDAGKAEKAHVEAPSGQKQENDDSLVGDWLKKQANNPQKEGIIKIR